MGDVVCGQAIVKNQFEPGACCNRPRRSRFFIADLAIRSVNGWLDCSADHSLDSYIARGFRLGLRLRCAADQQLTNKHDDQTERRATRSRSRSPSLDVMSPTQLSHASVLSRFEPTVATSSNTPLVHFESDARATAWTPLQWTRLRRRTHVVRLRRQGADCGRRTHSAHPLRSDMRPAKDSTASANSRSQTYA